MTEVDAAVATNAEIPAIEIDENVIVGVAEFPVVLGEHIALLHGQVTALLQKIIEEYEQNLFEHSFLKSRTSESIALEGWIKEVSSAILSKHCPILTNNDLDSTVDQVQKIIEDQIQKLQDRVPPPDPLRDLKLITNLSDSELLPLIEIFEKDLLDITSSIAESFEDRVLALDFVKSKISEDDIFEKQVKEIAKDVLKEYSQILKTDFVELLRDAILLATKLNKLDNAAIMRTLDTLDQLRMDRMDEPTNSTDCGDQGSVIPGDATLRPEYLSQQPPSNTFTEINGDYAGIVNYAQKPKRCKVVDTKSKISKVKGTKESKATKPKKK